MPADAKEKENKVTTNKRRERGNAPFLNLKKIIF
jgi:hypothetical protein